MRPINGYVLVRRYERPEQSLGGIWIPETARTDYSTLLFEVVDSGEWWRTPKGVKIAPTVSKDDIVLMQRGFRNINVTLDKTQEDLIMVWYEDIAAVVASANEEEEQ